MRKRRNERRRLLLVDDDPSNIRVLAKTLEDSYELHFATSGERALDLAGSLDVDLILLDVVMPGLDGFEVLTRLKAGEATRGTPVIFVTAADEVEDEARGLELGAVDYITKPISPPIVRARVRTHLTLKEQREQLEERAYQDGLTGLANRRRFDEVLPQATSRCARLALPLSVLLLDVDCFKQFNDRYGHLAGDDCLRRVGGALPDVFRRPGDICARYGGEEFVVLLPETDAEAARGLATALLSRIHDLAIPHESSRAASIVTVSVGGVTVVPAAEVAPPSIVELADRMLYEAKNSGRDRGVLLDQAAAGERSVLRAAAAFRPDGPGAAGEVVATEVGR